MQSQKVLVLLPAVAPMSRALLMFKQYNYCGACNTTFINCWCDIHYNSKNIEADARIDGCTCGDPQCTCVDEKYR